MLGADERIDAASVNAILKAFDPETNRPIGGYVANIQGNLAVSANKLGVRVEPMAAFRARRKKQDSKKQ
jgi:tRNA(Ile)-lysidine synthase